MAKSSSKSRRSSKVSHGNDSTEAQALCSDLGERSSSTSPKHKGIKPTGKITKSSSYKSAKRCYSALAKFFSSSPLSKKLEFTKKKVPSPTDRAYKLLHKSVATANHFIDTLEGCLTAALDDQIELCDAFRIAAVVKAVTEASVDPHGEAPKKELSPGKRYAYKMMKGALEEFISENKADLFKGVKEELLQFYQKKQKILSDLELQKALMGGDSAKALAMQLALWGCLGLVFCGVVALTIAVHPAGVAVAAIAISSASQVRQGLYDLFEKRKSNIQEIQSIVEGHLVDAQQATGDDLEKFQNIVAEDYNKVRKSAKKVLEHARSVLDQNGGDSEEANLVSRIQMFQRKQRQFERKLRLLIEQVRESRKTIRKEVKALLKARNGKVPVSEMAVLEEAPLVPRGTL